MLTAAFWYCLVISTILTITLPVSCFTCISCKCGFSNKNYTQCIEKELKEEYTCKRWAECQTCKDNTSYCITCPPKQFGPLCTESVLENIRRKRQVETPEIFCKFPEVDTKGMIIEPNDRKKKFPPGSDIKFDCEEDHELEGNNWIIYCKRDGQWTAEPPKCRRIPTSDGSCRPTCKPVDCEEILISGHNKSGVYTIWPRNRVVEDKPIEVYCDMLTDGGGWTVIQRRGNFKRPVGYFFKNWTDYKKGFGSLEEDFWLGNDNIFALTNQRLTSIRFDLKAVDGEKRYALYDEFWIDDEDHKYTLHIKDYSGDAGDSMIKVQNNMKFSTKDQKNDVNPKRHCAHEFKGAWWYNNCHEANLNGLYLAGKHESFADGINWLTFRGFYESLDSTEMKIRSKDFKKNFATRENSKCR